MARYAAAALKGIRRRRQRTPLPPDLLPRVTRMPMAALSSGCRARRARDTAERTQLLSCHPQSLQESFGQRIDPRS